MSLDAATVRVTCRDVGLEDYHVQLREIVDDDGLPSTTNTLVILFGFANQPMKVVNRFCNMYHALGFNVLFVPGYVTYISWPRNATKLSQLVLHYLDTRTSNYPNLLFHAISLGCHILAAIVAMMRPEETRYAGMCGKVRGVIYDSIFIGTFRHLSVAVGITFSDNRLIQRAIAISMLNYFKMMALLDRPALTIIRRASQNLKLHPLPVPTLLFHCCNDRMCSHGMLNALVGKWQETLSDAFEKRIWQDSKHANHLRFHTDEYLQILHKFVKDIPELAAGINTRSKL